MSKKIDLEKKYRFCGNGQCVPGLPQELSLAQAQEMKVGELLEAAIANGNYQPVEPESDTQEA
jgi:hypothetical protein